MKKYQIGEFSKLMGVSHDYLKYYEKNEILEAERKTDSKYRYFNFSDAGKIADTRKYRNLGFSVKDVKSIFSDLSLEETLALFAEKRDESELNLFKMERQIEYMDKVLNSFSSGKFIDNTWYLLEKEEFFFFPHTKNSSFYLDDKNSLKIHKWIDEQPLTCKTLCINLDKGENLNYDYVYGYSADKTIVDKLNLDIGAPVEYVQAGRCFVYYFKTRKDITVVDENFIPSALSSIEGPISTMKNCGLISRNSKAYCELLHISRENDFKNFYWILYVPVL